MNNLWPQNPLTKLFHLDFPIIQAPMAGCSTPELVTSICYAGGLGSLGVGYMSPKEIRDAISLIRLKTRKRFNINLFCHNRSENKDLTMKAQLALNPYRRKMGLEEKTHIPKFSYFFEDQIEVILEEKVPIFSFCYGIPHSKYLQALKENGTLILGTATNIEEVKALSKLPIDAIILQGAEAGGPRSTFLGNVHESLIGLMDFIPQAVEHTSKPLIAAGGIMNSKEIIAALLLGAKGVQMGTAFLASTESGVPGCYKRALLKMQSQPTVITSAYSGRASRCIKTPFLEKLEKLPIAPFPYQNALMHDLRKKSQALSNIDFIPLYAGQGFPLISNRSAIEIFYELAQGVSLLFKELKN